MALRHRALLALPALAAARDPAAAAESATLLLAAPADSAGALWAGAFAPFLERHARRASALAAALSQCRRGAAGGPRRLRGRDRPLATGMGSRSLRYHADQREQGHTKKEK
ncbi:hypothetical protein CR162_03925 [Pseudoroseomonas rhizosphaerae]|uniref:Uncharacterized protein n=1 Tax=Teichococcus rhizosphaerae TaxID=1335062 RepID=A0A2C6Y6N6_9PROT|nr:hypothetical protein CR162_03925 [Pseudoroseomonas rhizosphaerae]